MKVAIVYPPLERKGKTPLLTQNRHFRYSSSEEVRIFPLIPASGATLLRKTGHEVLFLDATALHLTSEEFLTRLKAFHPGLIFMETKAPVIKDHWAFIKHLKEMNGWTIALGGDHVSYFPKESLESSPVDYCITGGDYDVSLAALANALERKGDLPAGLHYRKQGMIQNSGKPAFIENLDSLPFINRDLAQWDSYREAYLYSPCAYILTGRGCGTRKEHTGRCTFCIWQYALWNRTARLRSPENVAEEIGILLRKYRIKEVFDDNESGAIWDREWIERLHTVMDKKRIVGKVFLSSNARGDCLDAETCHLLKRTGYRLLKVGLESGNGRTLSLLKKDESVEEIVQGVKNAKDAGLNVMLTVMTGYPWEGKEEAEKTFDIVKNLLLYKTHAGDCIEASVLVPYPGTPLFSLSKAKGWLKIAESAYENMDVSVPILSSETDSFENCSNLWRLHLHPRYIIKSLFTLRRREDFALSMRGLRSLLGHVRDFSQWRISSS